MKKTLAAGAVGILAVALIGAVALLRNSRPNARAKGVMSQLAMRNLDIAFYEKRFERDPQSAADLAQVAGLYLQRSRETGDFADFRRAEAAARRSLALRTSRNSKTFLTLASSLLAQHRFVEARDVAEDIVALEPDVASYRALLGEIQLELGDYKNARITFDTLEGARDKLAVAPRLARWREITGQSGEARKILFQALREAESRPDMPNEQVAWFYLRVGDIEYRNGRLDEAQRAFKAGLEVEPSDFRLLSALARLEAARGKWKNAIAYAKRVGPAADISTLALLGDAHAALGDEEAAEAYFRAAESMGRTRPEPFNRQWTLFLLEHDRDVDSVLALLQREIEMRRDVYGYDQLAWALYKSGNYVAARQAMRSALGMGTQDATMHFHAGMIERALGVGENARFHLRQALDINPVFHPRYAEAARMELGSLETVAAR